MSRIWTSFRAWVKDMHQAWSRHIVIVSVVAVAFGMLQKPLLMLLSFIESTCLAHLSPDWFGGFISLLACYLLKRERDYWKIYVPRPVSLWLILLLGIYLYYRHWDGSFSFWPISFSFWKIPYLRKLAWSDLLLIPWGGAVAIALRSRSKEDRFFLVLVLLLLCVVLYFVPQAQGKPSLVWALLSLSIAVGSCLLAYLILYRWSYSLQPTSKEEALGLEESITQMIEVDSPIGIEKEDWLDFSTMARALYRKLQASDLSKSSLTVGIIAPWGMGKSSFINLLMRQVEEDQGIIVTFNPRGSKSVSSIQEDFFGAFARELSRHYLGFALLLARYTKHIGLLNLYEWTRPLGSLLTLLLSGKEREAVNRSLRELGKRVYVLLDDLDRLSAKEILEVLKLMDRNASFSNTVFITAYDKAYVNNVLKKHLDHGLNHSFIDKYIAWEVPLSEPNKVTMGSIMDVVLLRKLQADATSLSEPIQMGWRKASNAVVKYLDSMRDLKRYLNLMLPRYRWAIKVVDAEEYFLLYLLCFKDWEVYRALASCRILQLDRESDTYGLTPNFEEELNRISRWNGTKAILQKLFPPKGEEVNRASEKALRCRGRFSTYFVGLGDFGMPYYREVRTIIFYVSVGLESNYEYIDNMITLRGADPMIKAFLFLVKLSPIAGEDRANTIKLMAYAGVRISQLEGRSNLLMEELKEMFSQARYIHYRKLGIVQDLRGYQGLLQEMLRYMCYLYPFWLSELIDGVLSQGREPFQECVFSVDGISDILLDCQKSYYRSWTPSPSSCEYARSFVLKKYMEGSLKYMENATLSLISLIKRYPDECLWIALAIEPNRLRDYFSLEAQTRLLGVLDKWGFSLEVWLDLIRTPRFKYILNYVRSLPERGGMVLVAPLPDEEVDLGSLDYIYRAILAHEARERQSASR